jgi:hypothetical protein
MQTLKKSTVVAVLVVSIAVFRANLAYGSTPFQKSFSGKSVSATFTLPEAFTINQVNAGCTADKPFSSPQPYMLFEGTSGGSPIYYSVAPTISGNSIAWISVAPSATSFDPNSTVSIRLSGNLGVSAKCNTEATGLSGKPDDINQATLKYQNWGRVPPDGLAPVTLSATSQGGVFLSFTAANTLTIAGVDVHCYNWSGPFPPCRYSQPPMALR